MEYDAFSSTSAQDLQSCDICGRNFNSDALQRHIPICQKASLKKRKVFDAAKHRTQGTDIVLPKNRKAPGQPPPVRDRASKSQSATHTPTKSNWRAKHEDFVNTIRAARGVQRAMAEGAPLPPPPPPSINPDYIQCPHCSRRFNQQAAERHMNFCKEQQSRLPNKKVPDKTALQRADARKQYSQSTSSRGVPRGGRTAESSPGQRSSRAAPGSALHNQGGYNASRYSNESQPDGRALRTGRNTETYTEARQLSSTQRSTMPNTRRGLSSQKAAPSSRYGSGGGGRGNEMMSPVSGTSYSPANGGDLHTRSPAMTSSTSKFCADCGSKYMATAQFCHMCGVKRI